MKKVRKQLFNTVLGWGGEHTVQCTDCIPGTYVTLLTNVIPQNLI